MEYRLRKQTAERLADNAFIEKDKQLLARYEPNNKLLRRGLDSPLAATLSFELLYALLNHVSEQEIVTNRNVSAAVSASTSATAVPAAEEKKQPAKKKKTNIPPSAGKNLNGKTSSGPR